MKLACNLKGPGAVALGLAVLMPLGTGVAAQDQLNGMVYYTTDQSFDDVTFGLENAIIDEGLVIDHVAKGLHD